jgi:5-methylcytosine-specific restriction protein A
MKPLDVVFQDYETASQEHVGGRLQRKRVGDEPQSEAEKIIKDILPEFFAAAIERTGRKASDYRVYGSVGQINFPFARIPWVAALHKQISTSTERGYYIVLLFREDMRGCVLSLNQGYTQYRDAFGTDPLAAVKIRESASVAASYLDLPGNFISGPIYLAAKAGLGMGYENGAIASVAYSSNEELTPEQLVADFAELLNAYDILRQKIGFNIVDAASPPTEDDFQETVTALSKPSPQNNLELPPGPVAPPPKLKHSPGSRFKRDPRISGRAIYNSGYQCEVNASHLSFLARTTKKNFVEAHHLIPVQFQEKFKFGLDVPENVIALCPTCHRKLHHGQLGDKTKILLPLLSNRSEALKDRGLGITSEQLLSFYRAKLEEE